MSNICDFVGILKTECNLQHLTRNCRIKNLDDFERDEAGTYLYTTGLLNVKDKGMNEQVFGNVFERSKSKCCAVLMKHRHKVKGEVITFQIAQQLKNKNNNVVPGQLFCCQYKAKFLLETDSLY